MVVFFGHVRFRPLVNRPRISDTQLVNKDTVYVAHRIRIGEIPLYPELACVSTKLGVTENFVSSLYLLIFFFISFELGERPTS